MSPAISRTRQTTLQKPVTLTGRGLHTNSPSKVCLMPAPPGVGIALQRMVVDLRDPVALTPSHVVDTSYALTVEVGGRKVKSLEHLLAACYGMGVDNVIIQVWGEEIPSMDGSAWPFVQSLRRAGIKTLNTPVRWITLNRVVSVGEDQRYIIGFPAKNFELCVAVEYKHPALGRQIFEGSMSPRVFSAKIAKAKTFGWTSQIADQQRKGLIKGGDRSNALVFGPKGLENPRMLTYRNEPVRHKALDLMGALALLGGRLLAHVVAIRPGHGVDKMFIKQIESLGRAAEAGTAVGPSAARRLAA